MLGSSFGVFKVYKDNELKEYINKALEYDNEVLVESFLDGVEVSSLSNDAYDFHTTNSGNI